MINQYPMTELKKEDAILNYYKYDSIIVEDICKKAVKVKYQQGLSPFRTIYWLKCQFRLSALRESNL